MGQPWRKFATTKQTRKEKKITRGLTRKQRWHIQLKAFEISKALAKAFAKCLINDNKQLVTGRKSFTEPTTAIQIELILAYIISFQESLKNLQKTRNKVIEQWWEQLEQQSSSSIWRIFKREYVKGKGRIKGKGRSWLLDAKVQFNKIKRIQSGSQILCRFLPVEIPKGKLQI